MKVCGIGTLITLDGDTLKNTLLVRSQRSISSTFSNESVRDIMVNDSDKLIVEDCCWFAPGYRYAVFETMKVSQAMMPYASVLQTAYYNAIDDQANLPYDEENVVIRKMLGKNESTEKSISKQTIDTGSVLHINDNICCAILCRGNELRLTIDYEADNEERFSLSLYNLSGMQIFSKDLGCKRKGLYNDNFSVGNLSRGVYVLAVFVNGKKYSKEISL